MNKNLKYIIFILAFLQAVVVFVAFAQEDSTTLSNDTRPTSYEENLRRWQDMSEEQREAMRQKVKAMDFQQRETIRENAKKFKQLPKEEQNRIQNNFQKFRNLPPKKRNEIRSRHNRFQQMPAGERQELIRQIRHKKMGADEMRKPSPKKTDSKKQSEQINRDASKKQPLSDKHKKENDPRKNDEFKFRSNGQTYSGEKGKNLRKKGAPRDFYHKPSLKRSNHKTWPSKGGRSKPKRRK